MRSGCKGGLCSLCGVESDEGLYWRCVPIVLDFGVPTMPIIEPDMSVPTRCDNCELLVRVVQSYREDAVWAQRVYCAINAHNALKLLGWRPHEALRKVLARKR
jgi:hypothetical protein